MKIVVLGGNNPRHHDWIRELGTTLQAAGHTVILHDYEHWQTGAPLADIDHEIEHLHTLLKTETDYLLIAKSIGTVIATLGVARNRFAPAKCLLLGVPFTGIAGETPEFLPGLATLPRTLFIQNEFDPYGSAEGLDMLLTRSHPSVFDLVVVENNTTHDYTDFDLLKSYC